MKKEEMKKQTESPPSPETPTFSSLPYDLVFNCLARVPRFHHPTLSLVSKDLRSLMASPQLEATRTRMGISETYLCLCVCSLGNYYDISSRWFTVATIPKHEKLKPIPSLSYLHPQFSSLLTIGSEIYNIGGFFNLKKRKKSKRVLVFDFLTNQRRRLPKMRVPRVDPAVDVINGKIYVIGGTGSNNIEDWGEVYDPKTQMWEPVLPTTQDLTIQMNVVPGRFVMGGKFYGICGDYKLQSLTDFCLVEIDNVLYLTRVYIGMLFWYDLKEPLGWNKVKGLDEQPKFTDLTSLASSIGGRRRVTVWWKTIVACGEGSFCEGNFCKECKSEIWCAEISFERRGGLGELWGFVEWSKIVLTLDRCDSHSLRFDSVILTY
ncbi:unnamed protein product [Arabidopsis lyrata]|uniref:Uncharacterized protein n=1 Tax=Arabidopsis lyrata subsp. lyrata TaxID=81972 RepID=D7KIJ6_ARALL|nr:putative F-box/kelch-repeat protein At5g03000 [Arabidopsis lyrata subsp. lyrata]EFH67918.1 hypothetical protein ARALYDRAFT_892156 [Arabidopsis lyrata subsp. lyrata]CAH8255320.1 unnamed protein product [Arabidopsis lyrata]|eukprot:XP_002891659.1 putative F-box/kelch-repeat protein At5g03000 [Arabidopsis lyrata subsp. lyrata]